jgi:hypothetical protein
MSLESWQDLPNSNNPTAESEIMELAEKGKLRIRLNNGELAIPKKDGSRWVLVEPE